LVEFTEFEKVNSVTFKSHHFFTENSGFFLRSQWLGNVCPYLHEQQWAPAGHCAHNQGWHTYFLLSPTQPLLSFMHILCLASKSFMFAISVLGFFSFIHNFS
jgi:hypothetical protein